MANFVTHNLSRLATFKGRDTRAQFWPYVAVVFLLQQAIMMVVMTTAMAPLMNKMQSLALKSPEVNDAAAMEAWNRDFMAMFQPVFSSMMLAGWTATAVLAALYAGAVTRRLHDRGFSGFWGLLPLPFLGFGGLLGPKVVESVMNPGSFDANLLLMIMLSNTAGFAALITLIVLLAKRSDPAINRYGPPTVV